MKRYVPLALVFAVGCAAQPPSPPPIVEVAPPPKKEIIIPPDPMANLPPDVQAAIQNHQTPTLHDGIATIYPYSPNQSWTVYCAPLSATEIRLNPDETTDKVRLDKGRKLSMPLADARKVDLGYASTSHAAQGATVDRVITNIDSGRSPELVNQRQAYVSWSRARIDLRIYTDDIERMRRAVARTQEKELALDIIERQQRRPSTAMRI